MDELSPQELEQFKAMEAQEVIEKPLIEAQKATPVEEVIEEPIDQPKETPPEEKKVALAALHEERERRKTAEATARQLEQNQIRLDERLNMINAKLNPPAHAKQMPDADKDPLGALKATQEELKAFREFQQRQTEATQQNQYVQDVMTRAAAAEAEYIKKTPDYSEASVFLKKSRASEMASLGMSPLQIQQTMANESVQLADSALRQGKDPAELVYNLASSRGYARTTQIVPAQPEGDAEKLAKIAAGQKANMSLGNLNSTPSKPVMNGKDILAMDDGQFDVWLSKLSTKERAKFLGE